MTKNKNIYLKSTAKNLNFKSRKNLPHRHYYTWPNPNKHAQELIYQLKNIQQSAGVNSDQKGTYLEFLSKPGYDLSTERLENIKQGIRLRNIQKSDEDKDDEQVTSATVFVPKGKDKHFIKKINEFKTKKTKNGNPKNSEFVTSVANIHEACVEELWTGKKEEIPINDSYCELWLSYNGSKNSKQNKEAIENTLQNFEEACKNSEVKICEKEIIFPERIVKLVYANREKLSTLLKFSDSIAEIRRAPIVSNFFTKLSGKEQEDWIDDLLERTEFKNSGDVAVCILDTGVNFEHPLLKKAMKNSTAVNENWSLGDINGHGTQVAGVVVYNDLRKIIAGSSTVIINHSIESVKIFPANSDFPKNDEPELYGNITQQAISKSEIADPDIKNRIICMTVTALDYNTNDGSPTSWSAELDQITSGAGELDNRHLLFLVSAGNTSPDEVKQTDFPTANQIHQIENPGQSWNAITVGAYTSENDVELTSSENKGFHTVSSANSLSPFSSTSTMWDRKWPIKPDILLDGGNMMTNDKDVDCTEDLELLTTNSDLAKPLSTISGTSSAVAQASNMAAVLSAKYPEYWPETIRALLIHSASWTPEMVKIFCPDNKKSSRNQLLRICGYGIPNLDKAKYSSDNSVNLIIQDEIQPFNKGGMNEMKLHSIPWPSEVLENLGETEAKLKITLSYFIEPGPGNVGWKNKYRYPSAGLRFDVNGIGETEEEFTKRVDVAMRNGSEQEYSKKRDWYLGPKSRDVGSIHSDYIETSAIELSDATKIAVYPVGGWWKERKYLGKVESKMRYSLIVSIETPSTKVDLYNEIQTKIKNPIKLEI